MIMHHSQDEYQITQPLKDELLEILTGAAEAATQAIANKINNSDPAFDNFWGLQGKSREQLNLLIQEVLFDHFADDLSCGRQEA